MPVSAWITLVVVSLVVYGGFALCVAVAAKRGAQRDAEDEGGERDGRS
jgi:hypothetical protein